MAARYNPPPNWPAPPAGWTPPAGWQPDPAWGPAPDGWQVWIDDAVVASDPTRADAPAPSRPWFKKKRVIIPGAVVLLGIAIGVGGGGDDDERTPPAGAATQEAEQKDGKSPQDAAAEASAKAEEAAAEASAKAEEERLAEEKRLADEAAAAEAEAAEAALLGTLSQQNAYGQAKSYVETMPFSRAGLLAQLTSEYGGQFPAEDAEFAVARLEADGGVDWLAEAVEAAESYQEVLPMSRQGLIDQLTSEYGSQFTLEQATHAVDTLGL